MLQRDLLGSALLQCKVNDLLVLLSPRAQAMQMLLAPFLLSTPFPTTRYQNKADCGEWCCYFCNNSPLICHNGVKYGFFSVLHKAFTAFAYRIRSPPSEV